MGRALRGPEPIRASAGVLPDNPQAVIRSHRKHATAPCRAALSPQDALTLHTLKPTIAGNSFCRSARFSPRKSLPRTIGSGSSRASFSVTMKTHRTNASTSQRCAPFRSTSSRPLGCSSGVVNIGQVDRLHSPAIPTAVRVPNDWRGNLSNSLVLRPVQLSAARVWHLAEPHCRKYPSQFLALRSQKV